VGETQHYIKNTQNKKQRKVSCVANSKSARVGAVPPPFLLFLLLLLAATTTSALLITDGSKKKSQQQREWAENGRASQQQNQFTTTEEQQQQQHTTRTSEQRSVDVDVGSAAGSAVDANLWWVCKQTPTWGSCESERAKPVGQLKNAGWGNFRCFGSHVISESALDRRFFLSPALSPFHLADVAFSQMPGNC